MLFEHSYLASGCGKSCFFRPVRVDLRIPGVYNIPRKCGQVDICHIEHSFNIRLKKHYQQYPTRPSEQVDHGKAEYQLGALPPAPKHSILSTKLPYGSHHQGDKWDQLHPRIWTAMMASVSHLLKRKTSKYPLQNSLFRYSIEPCRSGHTASSGHQH